MVFQIALIAMEIPRVFSLKTFGIVMDSRKMDSEEALQFRS
ncbi:hypothetical protein J2X31_002094 [Flavobacterium arsenatis]|uniref:Uncharacterized protein n=1 Tax=Flavobacterium arsenatis TaxID=1484332 RepID=A0ABU1TQ21_9FLAO|nr:hypothetical protein [Flavobacterium arsenatis]MDR6968079.1 hypothetical protein [Flavobacterium arsenatis]